ncbi:NAD(P)-binding protein [Mycena galopus ATCC 62051]|nr:NAD(P)-binding protein [Mycena galopus ATCC 62051]
MLKIFLTGATGFIGGTVLSRLLDHPLGRTFEITVLVRSSEKASLFNRIFGQKHSLTAVVGSHSDLELLRKLSADAEIVFACANADDLPAARAILSGMQDRHSNTGVVPTLIHTSGTGVLSDDANGMYSSPTIYSDLDVPQLEALPPDQPHRDVDLALVEADSQGYVKTYIVLPATIYGFASGPLVKAGLQNYRSQQIPRLANLSLKRGQGGMIGRGENRWGNVNIDDVAELYIRIFDLLAAKSPPPHFAHGRAGFYFGENGEHTLSQVGEAIAKALSGIGKGTPSPTAFTDHEMRLFFPNGTSIGTNSRCRADRGAKIGWRPTMKTQDMLLSIKAEVEASLSR